LFPLLVSHTLSFLTALLVCPPRAGRSLAFDTTYFIEYFALDLIMDEKTGA